MVEQPESDYTDIQPLLADLRAALGALYGDRLARLVLVVLDGPVQPGREIRRMSSVRTQLGLEYERAISLLPVSEADYRDRTSGWLQNARQEGVTV